MTAPDLRAAFDAKFGTTTDWDAIPWDSGDDVPDVDSDGGWTPNELDRLADDRAGRNIPNGRP